jgi:hypothetical protein
MVKMILTLMLVFVVISCVQEHECDEPKVQITFLLESVEIRQSLMPIVLGMMIPRRITYGNYRSSDGEYETSTRYKGDKFVIDLCPHELDEIHGR